MPKKSEANMKQDLWIFKNFFNTKHRVKKGFFQPNKSLKVIKNKMYILYEVFFGGVATGCWIPRAYKKSQPKVKQLERKNKISEGRGRKHWTD